LNKFITFLNKLRISHKFLTEWWFIRRSVNLKVAENSFISLYAENNTKFDCTFSNTMQ